jgi:hypothetical protein
MLFLLQPLLFILDLTNATLSFLILLPIYELNRLQFIFNAIARNATRIPKLPRISRTQNCLHENHEALHRIFDELAVIANKLNYFRRCRPSTPHTTGRFIHPASFARCAFAYNHVRPLVVRVNTRQLVCSNLVTSWSLQLMFPSILNGHLSSFFQRRAHNSIHACREE